MHPMMKRILGFSTAAVATLGAGWGWGAAGRWDTARALRSAELRNVLREGRAAVLDARLDIYNVNFGDASRHLEEARAAVNAAAVRLQQMGRGAEAAQLDPALAHISEAQRLAGQLNQDANAQAASAAHAIGDVLTTADATP